MATKMAVGQLTESLGAPEPRPTCEPHPHTAVSLTTARDPIEKQTPPLDTWEAHPFLGSALPSHW